MTAKPRVLTLFTGGTISMSIVPGRGAVPARGGKEILAAVRGIEQHAEVVIEDFDRLPGPHWTPKRMLDLARRLDEALAGDDFVGAVVTHGTDTIEETAIFLDMVLATDKPVVLTGAMRTADDPVWDGPGNLLAAIRTAATPAALPHGVLVVMDDTVHSAREVTKGHTEAFGAFVSGEGGPLARVEWDAVHFSAVPARRIRAKVDSEFPDVGLITAAVGLDDRSVNCVLADGAKGLVVEAMGQGNVPPTMLPGIRAARVRGIPVVVSSRCRLGRTSPRYGYLGGGSSLAELGAIFAGGLPAAKARIQLMVLLAAGWDEAAIREAFEGAEARPC